MGLLPQPGCDPAEWPPGCESLFLQGNYLLEAALTGLIGFLPPEGSPCPSDFEAFISLNQPSVDQCDVLIAWLVSYAPTGSDTATQRRSASGQLFAPQWMATWQFELWEAAYPIPEGSEQIRLPSTEDLHEVNRHIYAHGYAMYHAVTAATAAGTVYPDGVDCSRVIIGQLVPLGPQGGCAGWRFTVDAEVPGEAF